MDRDGLSLMVERARIERGGDIMRGTVCGNGLNNVPPALSGVVVPMRGSLLPGLSQSEMSATTSGEELMAPEISDLKPVHFTGVDSGLIVSHGSCSTLLRDRDDRSAAALRKSFQS